MALALDAIGSRWAPLIVRDLLLGPKRYTDLLEGLPGIGTNILASRLAHLQSYGVVVKRTLPPPTPVAVYELTEAGEALAPVLRALRDWGGRYGPTPAPGDAARPAWIMQSATARGLPVKPGCVCEVRVGAESFALTTHGEGVDVRAGAASAPDAVVSIEPDLFLALATGKAGVADATGDIICEGDRSLANDVVAMVAGSVR